MLISFHNIGNSIVEGSGAVCHSQPDVLCPAVFNVFRVKV